jgi:hypothetical protein
VIRRVKVMLPYNDYDPGAVIVGIRKSPAHHGWDREDMLRSFAAANPGWNTLAHCTQHPAMIMSWNLLRIECEIAGGLTR